MQAALRRRQGLLDTWLSCTYLAPVSDDGRQALWEEATRHGDLRGELDRQPLAGAWFAPLGAGAANPKIYPAWRQALEEAIHQTVTLDRMSHPGVKLASRPDETEGDFQVRVVQALREKRDLELARLKAKYEPKLQVLADQLRRANERVEREKAQASQQKVSAALSFGATLLGALFGRKVASVGNVGRAVSTMKSASRIGKEAADVARASEGVEVLRGRLEALQAEFEREAAGLQADIEPELVEIQKAPVRPRKSDISVGTLGLCWVPWRQAEDGTLEPA